MALSVAAEEAFHAAIEAAYVMENMIKLWGRESYQALKAYDIYERYMEQYYDLTNDRHERFWNKHCLQEPWAASCRLYDC